MPTARAILSAFVVATTIGGVAPGEESRSGRVILFSWDGTPQWATEEVLRRFDLPNLSRLVREGALAEGMVSSFPTKTAAAHAMLWTGRYGHQNGVTANSVLLEPIAEHSRLEQTSGYRGEVLKAEPLWTMTARAGLPTYVFHATQSYPFETAERWLPATQADSLHLLYGYTPKAHRGRTYSEATNPIGPASGWRIAAGADSVAREIRLELGDDRWWGLFFDDPEDPRVGLDSLGLARTKQAADFEYVVAAGLEAPASGPLPVSVQGVSLSTTLRLFELDPAGERYLLYRASAKELAVTGDALPAAAELAREPFAGNSASREYRAGNFGPTLPDGGDGTAEDRLVRTMDDLAEQLRLQAKRVLDRRDYRLAILYSPNLDDAMHSWAGYLDPGMPGHDPQLAERLWPKLAAAYRTHERMLADAMEAAERDGATILLVSDHGMAGTNRLLNVNVALERAGLLRRTGDDRIDLSGTRALLLPLTDASVAVNSVDRPQGIVPPEKRQQVLTEVRRVLEGLRDPSTGETIVTGIYEAATSGELQPGGATTGDLFLDLAPGYYFSDRLEPNELVTVTEPSGNHIFLPTRRDMLSIFVAWGEGVPRGERWPRVRSIDIAPTVLELLDLAVPTDLPGRALLDRVAP